MQIISNVALISINETVLVQLISFLIFMFLINRIMFRPLRKTMAERDFQTENIHLDIAQANQQYDDLLHQIQGQEDAVRAAANEIRASHEEEGKTMAGQLLADARKEIADRGARTEAELAVRINAARQGLQAESDALALIIMEKALGRRVAP
jgi:F-type H+-transporting ATPase subunit b